MGRTLDNMSLPKYERVKRQLAREIRSGRYAPGSAFPSESQLLGQLPVSRPTLVRALRELVREGYLTRRQGQGTFVAETSSEARTRTLPLFIPASVHHLVGDARMVQTAIMGGIEQAIGQAGVKLETFIIADDVPGNGPQVRSHAGRPGRASINGVASNPLEINDLRELLDRLEPEVALILESGFFPRVREQLVRMGCVVWAVNEPVEGVNCVYIDQYRAGYVATKHLLTRGCQRIALLNGTAESYWGFAARRDGYLRALSEAGLQHDARLMPELRLPVDSESGRIMMRQVLASDVAVDGVVCVSDRKAIGAMAAAREAGLDIPGDLAFVGIDDDLAPYANPPLTSVHMPLGEVGGLAGAKALETFVGQHGNVPEASGAPGASGGQGGYSGTHPGAHPEGLPGGRVMRICLEPSLVVRET